MEGASVITEGMSAVSGFGDDCRFCGLAEREVALTGSRDVIIVPSVGSLTEGWLLAVPSRHVVALADLTLDERDAFIAASEAASEQVLRHYGPFVQFEHGPAAASRPAGCGVDHAHLHIVPVPLDLRRSAAAVHDVANELVWREASWPWDAADAHNAGLDYLFVRELDGRGWLAAHPHVPSQLFRRAIAKQLGIADWDWKVADRGAVYAATQARFTDSSQPIR